MVPGADSPRRGRSQRGCTILRCTVPVPDNMRGRHVVHVVGDLEAVNDRGSGGEASESSLKSYETLLRVLELFQESCCRCMTTERPVSMAIAVSR